MMHLLYVVAATWQNFRGAVEDDTSTNEASSPDI